MKKWTDEEVAYLKQNYCKKLNPELIFDNGQDCRFHKRNGSKARTAKDNRAAVGVPANSHSRSEKG